METNKLCREVALGLIACVVVSSSFADESVVVVAADGVVTVADTAGKTKTLVKSKSVLPAANILTTGPNARAVVRVGENGIIVVGKNSQVEINKTKDNIGFFKQITGVVYYAINSIKGKQRPIEVRTATTTIGIRGTRFLVTDTPELNEIGMRKGQVDVASIEGDFEIHKKAELDEFSAFQKEAETAIAKEQSDFEQYNAKNQKEFIEFKREFKLEANRMASFDGKKVVDLPLSGETKKNMESFEDYAEEWLKAIHD